MGVSLVSTAAARPAAFDRSASRRRSMLAKIHVAKKQLGLSDDDYRQIMMQETGHDSAADCSEAELERVIGRLQAQGFKPLPKAGPGAAQRPAQHPMAKKARALWISLYHLSAVRSPDEKALEAFAKRQLGCERLVWANQSDGFKLIEALKAMAQKHGWPQTDASGNNLSVLALHEGLCTAILWKLKGADEVPAGWTLNDAAFRLCGIECGAEGPMNAEAYQRLAKALGDKLRAAGGGK
jgi:phage gp16-like protein